MKKGFTLVEMLVSLGLVAMLAGIGFASTLRSNAQKEVTESAEMIRQSFMQAKSMAQAGKKDCTVCGATGGVCGNGDTPLVGWRTTIVAGTPVTMEIHGECGTVIPYTQFFASGSKSFPSRVTLTLTGSGNVVFYPLNKGTNLGSTTTVRLSSTITGLTSKTFTISRQGEISSIY